MREITLGPLAEGEAYSEGEQAGREQAIKDLEALAEHSEWHAARGSYSYRVGSTWLRTAIRHLREGWQCGEMHADSKDSR
jgi:hypothetical protein